MPSLVNFKLAVVALLNQKLAWSLPDSDFNVRDSVSQRGGPRDFTQGLFDTKKADRRSRLAAFLIRAISHGESAC